MNHHSSSASHYHFSAAVSLFVSIVLFTAPLRAQQTSAPTQGATPRELTRKADPTFDTLLSTDSYKLYGEIRNVGQLLTTGGAGEIVDPIIKLADPGPELKSIVKFLKSNAESLAASRLMFAAWPAHTGIPNTFVAIEFGSADEASKFAPKLETFLPTVLPPVPVVPEATPDKPKLDEKPAAKPGASATPNATPKSNQSAVNPMSSPAAAKPEERLPFVITHVSNLVFISDQPFKFEKLRPESRPLLSEDHNFRVARDRFSAEPVFLFFNVALEDRNRPKPSPTPVISDEERERMEREEAARMQKEVEEEQARAASEQATSSMERPVTATAQLSGSPASVPEASPTPRPTKEQEAQMVASSQIAGMFGALGRGTPQWPEAIGLALALETDDYVIRAILLEPQNDKRVVLPFVPEVIAGQPYAVGAASVLPADTEVFVSASIDFARTYEELKKQAEINAEVTRKQTSASGEAEKPVDNFAEFEKKAGFKIKDDLLPVLGNELAVAASLKELNGLGFFGMPMPPSPKSSTNNEKEKTEPSVPIFLVGIRDREAARRLMPRVLNGLGMGAANMLAQTERRGDSEIVNYAGAFSYAFVDNFLVVSDSVTVRRVADAAANHQTLNSNSAFRNSRHWQPRETLGEIYVSPALMESYQEQVRKQASTMDQAMRDFLMQLSPTSNAITYALSHDGLGSVHELHLPKNLIIAMVAGTSAAMSAMKQGSPEMNEMIAMSALQMLLSGESSYKLDKGSYGSIDNLVEQKLVSKDIFEKYGYKFDVIASSTGFEAVATPLEYGKTGKRSFFIDQSGVVRGDDHGGGPATSADKPVQ